MKNLSMKFFSARTLLLLGGIMVTARRRPELGAGSSSSIVFFGIISRHELQLDRIVHTHHRYSKKFPLERSQREV